MRSSATLEPEAVKTFPPVEESSHGRGAKRNLVYALVIMLTVCAVLSYFVKPKQPILEMVTPEQELPTFEAQFPGDTTLGERVKSSFGLAMVLMQSPYIDKNVGALENVRHWAKENFQSSPDFLHPVSVPAHQEPNDTILGALGYNLFMSTQYFLQARVADFLSWRIAGFHNDPAYQSFQAAYFDLFGKDGESATLLARYQSDKAKDAIPVFLWTLAWTGTLALSGLSVVLAARKRKFEALRWSLAGTWSLMCISYASTAWLQNSIPALLSGLVAAAAAIYLAKPFVLLTREDASLKVTFVQLSSRWIALATWLTYTLMAVTALTWIRGSVPQSPDPITLFLSGMSGNFIQDPEDGKRAIARLIGLVWVGVSLWAFFQKDQDARLRDELEEELNRL